MANVKITDLTAYTDPRNTDVLAIVDVTNNVTKKVSIANMAKNVSLGTAALPGVAFDGDPNTGIYSPGADELAVSTNGTQRLAISSTGAVTIPGTLGVTGAITASLTGAASSNVLKAGDTMTGVLAVTAGTAALPGIAVSGDLNTGIYSPGADQLAISTNGVERLRIDSNGDLLSGTTGNLGYGGRNIILKSGQGYAGIASLTTESRFFSTWDSSVIPMTFYQGGTERMRLDSSGRLGIGTTSPAAKLTVISTSSVNGVNNCTLRSSDDANSSFYIGHGPTSVVNIASDTSIGFGYTNNATYSERMRLDTSGRLLVGTSSSANDNIEGSGYANIVQILGAATGAGLKVGNTADFARINLVRSANVGTNVELGTLSFGAEATSVERARVSCFSETTGGSGGRGGRLVLFTTADGASSPTERMRINNSGQTFINATTDAAAAGARLHITGASSQTACSVRAGSDGTPAWYFTNSAGTTTGAIVINTSSTAYNTSSDYRLKENVVPLTGAADRVNQLHVRRFNFIADPDKTVDGFIAHEAQAVIPECVTGTKDEVDDDGNPVYQGIDQSKLVPLLTAALQEAIAKIEALEARLSALEAT